MPIRLPMICVPLTELPRELDPGGEVPRDDIAGAGLADHVCRAGSHEHPDVVALRNCSRGIGADVVPEKDVARRSRSVNLNAGSAVEADDVSVAQSGPTNRVAATADDHADRQLHDGFVHLGLALVPKKFADDRVVRAV